MRGFFLENNKFWHQAMGEINGAVAIYLMLNICLTAKTICAIDLANNISHISTWLKIEYSILGLTKKREVKVYNTVLMHKVHADNDDSSYYLADIVVCKRLANCLLKLLQQQIEPSRGGYCPRNHCRTCCNCTKSTHFC